ncbi:hypothetical protein [Pseudomonas sp. NA-150]|uniref:hypothetical protein n=1 Tax=Pseudomonas sp. NA-150 TaxID=3367525 RepID=UPI0037C8D036
MKRSIAFGFALSVLTATAAIASPQVVATNHSNTAVAQVSSEVHVADAGKTAVRPALDLRSGTLVAENRSEFGSQYQRY